MKGFRWLHLSDFHFGKKPDTTYQQPFIAKKIISHVTEYIKSNGEPDAVFITGDIANSASVDEYTQFNECIFLPLMQLFGDQFSERIFLVPGNHDVQRNTNKRFGREEFLTIDDGNFEPSDMSLDDRWMLVGRFGNFVEQAVPAYIKKLAGIDGTYNERIVAESGSVSVVGLNTSWLCRDSDDEGNLTPGIALLRAALEKTQPQDVVIVLGHHPLDWLDRSHRDAIKTLLSQYNALYLHGHMHAAWGKPEYVNGSSFMAIQAGASFQAPEGMPWKNSLLWGYINFENKYLELKPYEWSLEEQTWKHSSAGFPEAHRDRDVWRYELPKTQVSIVSIKRAVPPGGWHVLSMDGLEKYTAPLSENDAVAFFDGAIPGWKEALSVSIPRREVVTQLVQTFYRQQGHAKDSEPVICTLLAAGCEGKTTALLQAAHEILSSNPTKKILYRKNNSRPFDVEQLLPVLSQHSDWLVVIDDADQVARAITNFIEADYSDFNGKIDFILACRDSDWKSSEAISLPWAFCSAYKSIMLNDLSKLDAEKIVEAWAAFGARGLGEDLNNLDAAVRVEKLRFYAKQEAKSKSGAFFGALLLSRHNGDLLSHAAEMLSKLNDISIDGDKTLRDALGYIAAMHAEDFDKLSLEV